MPEKEVDEKEQQQQVLAPTLEQPGQLTDVQGLSLGASALDVIQARLTASGVRRQFSRVFFVGRITDGVSMSEIGPFHDRIIQSIEGAKFSGFTLVMKYSVATVLEAEKEYVSDFLLKLTSELADRAVLEPVRILAVTEDAPEPCFPVGGWAYRSVAVPAEPELEILEEEYTTAAFDVYSKLLRLGKKYLDKGMSAPEYQSALEKVKSQSGDLLPSNERVLALVDGGGELAFELSDYADNFLEPIHVDIESEKVWPVQPIVLY